jgi:hypothetical protein
MPIEFTGFDEYVMLLGVASQDARLAEFKTVSLTRDGRIVSAVFRARDASQERGYPDFTFEEELPSSFSAANTVTFLSQWLTAQEEVWVGGKLVTESWGKK